MGVLLKVLVVVVSILTMSVPRFSAILATRKCKTTNTHADSFANITADLQIFLEDNEKAEKEVEVPRLNIRKISVFVEEGGVTGKRLQSLWLKLKVSQCVAILQLWGDCSIKVT